jgi:hypothetical protein
MAEQADKSGEAVDADGLSNGACIMLDHAHNFIIIPQVTSTSEFQYA